ncbi:MAG: HAD hydrolase family protein, partial [Patescibacteria group bacterium]
EAVEESIKETGVIDLSVPAHGERIEVRGAQVTLSALGQTAPVEEKELWDQSGEKRNALRAAIAGRLPEYDVKRGGSTSIDVTKHGVNKAYGVRKLAQHIGIPVRDMLYVGDALFPGGNDEVVKETGIPTTQVSGPEETETLIRHMLWD